MTKYHIVAVFLLLLVVTNAQAQCVVTNTAMTTIGSTQGITKTLSAATSCNATAEMALSCFPGPTAMVVNMLNAVARTMVTMNPYCHWDCGCSAGMAPDVIIDVSDGLPVELLQFEVGED